MEDLRKLDELLGSFQTDSTSAEIERLANGAGVSPEKVKIKTVALNWAQNCLLVELHIGRSRFERALEPPDLGLNENDNDIKDYIGTLSLGRQLLAAGYHKELLAKLNNIEGKARNLVRKYSIETAFGRAVSCVPNSQGISPFEIMTNKLDRLEADYRETCDILISQLDEMKNETEAVIYAATDKIFRMIKGSSYIYAPEEFKNQFVEKALKHFPSESQVRKSYRFNLEINFVPLSQHERELSELKHVALATKSELISSIRSSYEEKAEKFVTDILANLRQIIYEQVALSLDTIRTTGSMPGAVIVGLRKMVEEVENLNFIDDHEVTRQITRLKAAIGQARERDPGEVALLLEQLKEENRRTLMELGQKPRAVRSRSKATDPKPPQEIKARQRRAVVPANQLTINYTPERRRRA